MTATIRVTWKGIQNPWLPSAHVWGAFKEHYRYIFVVYEIKPKSLSTSFEHLLYKMVDDTELPPKRCGLTDEDIARQLKFLQESVNYTFEAKWVYWLVDSQAFSELAVLVDHGFGIFITKVILKCTV